MVSDEQLQKAARRASRTANSQFRTARAALSGVRGALNNSPALLSWGDLGDKLRKHPTYKAAYQELLDAVAAAEDAISRAENACGDIAG